MPTATHHSTHPLRHGGGAFLRLTLATAAIFVAISSVGSKFAQGQNEVETFAAASRVLCEKCLSCHNAADRQGDFSLQDAASLLDSGFLDRQEPEESHILSVLSSDDEGIRMPKDGSPLTPEEIEAVRRWVGKGAPWPAELELHPVAIDDFDWWSYKPIQEVQIPQIESSWIRNPIDAFILNKLQQEGLTHAEPANRRDLIRRVTYDLTGLPPSADEVAAFQRDTDPTAYGELIERLLSSDRYGERWARHWLDVVKFADTCGYDKDKLRPNAWPYRDYVIRSLNEDKPYSRFIQEQIAGDVLFPGQPDGILGLGFIAAGPWDFIGHVEVPETKLDGKVARNLDRDDMVSNTINTFCSLTVQCARCHNHKFDPITQQDYYGLQAIFSALDRAERPYDIAPETQQQKRELESELERAQKELRLLEEQFVVAGGTELRRLETLVQELKESTRVHQGQAFGFHSAIASNANTTKWLTVELEQATSVDRVVLYPCHDDFNSIGSGFCFPQRFKIELSHNRESWILVADQTLADYPNPLLQPYSVSFAPRDARWIRITATKLRERKDDFAFALAEVEVYASQNAARTELKPLKLSQTRASDSIEAPPRWAKANLSDGHFPEHTEASPEEEYALALKALHELTNRIATPEYRREKSELEKLIAELESSLASLPKGKMVYAATTHFKPQGNFKPTAGIARNIHVLNRGNVSQPREVAHPALLRTSKQDGSTADNSIPLTSTEAERRATLARWLTGRENPFVWRSIVNRVWLHHFGSGLVDTPNDFGRMGSLPTHPELLDWLAIQFRDGKQSLKDLHRLILNSNTYQQSSDFSESNNRRDGANRYLWRMNRRRLSAEEIRDSILSVSGVLDLKMGGPGFYLFHLEKTAHSPHYEYHKFDPRDKASYRRSIYRFVVRSQPDPWMTTLDCADSSQSTPKRNETLTSLQALSLLNHSFNLTMAEEFAKQLEIETLPSMRARVCEAMRRVVQREPLPEELDKLDAYAQQHGLTNLCRFLFNLSEFVFLD